jgi:pimeloyl-ACP methyl ester carboxylesterase
MAPPSLLLVHGAANGAWVWDVWRRRLGELGRVVNVLDLRGHGRSLPIDFRLVTMEDYIADLGSVTSQIRQVEGRHPVLGGWSMGGLVALMYAAAHPETPALLLFAPSQPVEVAGRPSAEEVRRTPSGPFGPELYGLFPEDLEASRPALFDLDDEEARSVLEHSKGAQESGLARRQRKRGIKVAASDVRCPVLVVYGEKDTPELNQRLAIYLGAETISVPEMGHWGIVYHDAAVLATAPLIDGWLRANVGS